MDRQIAETLAVCDLVHGHKRSRKKRWLSFDEWNVWYRAHNADAMDGHRQSAPPLLEEIYNLEDALVVGGMLITLLRHANRVKIACLAQLINVIAPIMTNQNGLFRQTIYYPYRWVLQYAHGSVLNLLVQSPTYEAADLDPVPYLDAAESIDPTNGQTSMFILNRDWSKARELEIVWQDSSPIRALTALVLTGNDLKAVDGFDAPRLSTTTATGQAFNSRGKDKIGVAATVLHGHAVSELLVAQCNLSAKGWNFAEDIFPRDPRR